MGLDVQWGAIPIDDSSGLKQAWIKTRDQLNNAEMRNIFKAETKHFSRRSAPTRWFTEYFVRNLHTQMFKEVWEWAGIYYQGPLRNIGIKSTHIPIQVKQLCDDVHFWLTNKTELTFLEQSAHIHFRLAKIHPFHNGNGRHARLIADLYLHSLLGQRPLWPEIILTSTSNLRTEYIQSLKTADQGDLSQLVALIVKYGGKNPTQAEVLNHSLFKQNFSTSKLEETVQNLLNFDLEKMGC